MMAVGALGIAIGAFGLVVVLGAPGVSAQPGERRHPPGPDAMGPFNDEVYGAVSTDGVTFEELPGPFFERASVPEVVELARPGAAGPAGLLLLYFVDFSGERLEPSSEGVSVASSTDGRVWTAKEPVRVLGKRHRGAAVDPSVVQLADGRLRMYFFGSEATRGDPAAVPGDHVIYSALSEDGLTFTVESGVRFQATGITDPDVLRVGEEWWMVLSRGQETLLARSEDGLTFTEDPRLRLTLGGVPGAVELPDGRVRLFASGRGAILSALVRADLRGPPQVEPGARIGQGNAMLVADPSCVRRRDGSYYLVFKAKPFPRE
jgi:hypothetical protein